MSRVGLLMEEVVRGKGELGQVAQRGDRVGVVQDGCSAGRSSCGGDDGDALEVLASGGRPDEILHLRDEENTEVHPRLSIRKPWNEKLKP